MFPRAPIHCRSHGLPGFRVILRRAIASLAFATVLWTSAIAAEADPAETPSPTLSRATGVVIRRVEFEGNRHVSTRTLEDIARGYLDRSIEMEDLQALRIELTRAYVDRGYVNSGATLPDQTVADGVVRFRIVEGRLGRVRVEGHSAFNAETIERRLASRGDAILDVDEIEWRLQRLRRDPRIEGVAATLRPGLRPGFADLHVRISEARPWRASVQFDNHASPAIGELRGTAIAEHLNPTGVGDIVRASLGVTQGLIDADLFYQRPINRYGTQVGLYARYSESEIVEEPFDDLNIESTLMQAALQLSQPFQPTLDTTIELGLIGEWKQSRSTLDDISFDFTPGSKRGIARVSALRFFQALRHQTADRSIAARSTLSVGVPILRATQHAGTREDSNFVAWLARAQWVERLPFDARLMMRAEIQLASGPLLPVERFAIGGAGSVRGYRQNRLVRDTGFSGSVELRLPIWLRSDGRLRVDLAPFVDGGRSWNSGRGGTPAPKDLLGTGVGLRAEFDRRYTAELYWSESLKDVGRVSTRRSIQDRGFFFRVSAWIR